MGEKKAKNEKSFQWKHRYSEIELNRNMGDENSINPIKNLLTASSID